MAAKLPARLLFSYGLGDAGTGLAATVQGFYLFPFFTEFAGLSAGLAGTVLMVLKVWDGFNDPLIGWLSDHTHSRWGPRLPWIALGVIPLGLCFGAMWWVPPGGIHQRLLYYVVMAVAMMTAYTAVNLPYAALSTELSPHTNVRTRLNAARFSGSLLAGFIGLLLAFRFVSAGADGYLRLGLTGGLLVALTGLACAWGLSPYVSHSARPVHQPEGIRVQLLRIATNVRFRKVLMLYLLLWYALQLMQTVSLVYLRVVLHLQGSLALAMPMLFQLSAVAGLWVWSNVSRRRGRVHALRWGVYLWGIALVLALLLQPLDLADGPFAGPATSFATITLLVTITLLGLGGSTAFLIPWSLLPDAIDADPDRPAGLYTAWMVLVQKVGIGFGIFFLGIVLEFSGYVADLGLDQTPLALTTIRLCISVIPGVLIALGLIVMRRWPERAARAVEAA
ncbi:MAG: MFS transporter [Aphanocapsa feldmannii 277cV]|uniref:MFS transporter n=3 Tax=Aphanocapsa feldmannii TaxID=192050 RepID=A0A524RP53_9CHRO|nr:MAG: MFS transporter [Aphanocapsa feldmannii 277cV]